MADPTPNLNALMEALQANAMCGIFQTNPQFIVKSMIVVVAKINEDVKQYGQHFQRYPKLGTIDSDTKRVLALVVSK